jgi:hypothetical protein
VVLQYLLEMMRELLCSLVALCLLAVTVLVLVTRFALVETTLSALLSRALKGPSFDQTQSSTRKCRVDRRKNGVCCTPVLLYVTCCCNGHGVRVSSESCSLHSFIESPACVIECMLWSCVQASVSTMCAWLRQLFEGPIVAHSTCPS